MPLNDHFHPPLSMSRHWHAFHNAWATYLASALNEHLPPGYFAEANVQFGIEIDVAAFEEGRAGAANGWTPSAPVQTVPFAIATDQVEVLVYDREGGPTLAGAIELVSPANKDRAAHRDVFVSKCLTYLHQGVGLAIVDVVTTRSANLHDELMPRVTGCEQTPWSAALYAAAYHPVERAEQLNLDIWKQELTLGQSLPTMPLWLRGGPCLPVELETTYERTCREQRIVANGKLVQ